MYIEALESLGFSLNEAKIYRVLLELKRASIGDISTHAEIHRRNTYDAIQRLVYKGLAYQVLPKKTLTFAPVNPTKIKELLKEKTEMVNEAIPGLIKKYNQKLVEQSVYVYKGIGGFKNYIALELSVGKDIYGLGSKGSWFDPRLTSYALKSAKKYAEKGIKSHIIYDYDMSKHQDVLGAIGGDYKFFPKEHSTESSIDIFGDYVAIYSGMGIKKLSDEVTFFVLKDKTLAQDFMKWWQLMWQLLPEPKLGKSS